MTALGGSSSRALSINNNGLIVGYSFVGSGIRATLWSSGTMTDLGTFGGISSAAFGINDTGQVTGWANPVSGPNRSFLWDNGTMTDIGILGDSNAYGINSHGQVVGTMFNTGPYHAFLWSGGVTTDLGTLGGSTSYASAINDNGQVVGTAFTAGDGQHAFLWSNGSMTDLGVLPGGTSSSAYSINKFGQIVGRNTTGSVGAFLYDGSLHDLNSLLPNASGWFLTDARGINDAGQIVGTGIINNQTHAFLMTPVPIPAAFWLFGSGLIGLFGFMRRKKINRNLFKNKWGHKAPFVLEGGRSALSSLRCPASLESRGSASCLARSAGKRSTGPFSIPLRPCAPRH